MVRDTKTGKFIKVSQQTDTSDNTKSYKVYSDVLKKPFDTVAALEAAEAEEARKLAEKQATADKRKLDAKAVSEALLTERKVARDVAKAKTAIRDEYNKKLQELQEEYKA